LLFNFPAVPNKGKKPMNKRSIKELKKTSSILDKVAQNVNDSVLPNTIAVDKNHEVIEIIEEEEKK
jgi:hypothetical protein